MLQLARKNFMYETYKKEIVQHIIRNMLDMK